MKPQGLILAAALVLAPLVCWAQTSDPAFWRMPREELLPFAEQGIAEAQYRLGRDYHVSNQDDRFTEAEKWYRLAAAQGHSEAQYNLGLMHRRGQIESTVERHWWDRWVGAISGRHLSNVDHSAAFPWFQSAARQGHKGAQALVGQSYELGLGVEQDYEQAIEWYLLAADNGDDYSRYALGLMYEDGRGVPQDFDRAAAWYKSGIGNSLAVFSLALMYRDGRGVPQDFVQAYELIYPLAQAATGQLKTQSRAVIAELTNEMTKEQITEARQRVEDCAATRLYGRRPGCDFR